MKNVFVLAIAVLPGLAGCTQTPAEMIYTTAALAKYHQCDDLPRPSYDQCITDLQEREAEGRREAEEEYARRKRLEDSGEPTSEIARAMKDNNR